MKLPLHFGIAALLIVASNAAADAKHYYPPYPYSVPGYYPSYPTNTNGYNYNYHYNASYADPTYGGATVNPDGSFSNNGVSWNGADPTGGASGLRHGVSRTSAYQNPAAGGASALHPHPVTGYGYGTTYGYGMPLRQPVYHLYRPRAFTYHNE